ncbi:hypothetical protein T440DRAFT_522972 [Plenodomus tracheiphilus IPT5]|uniref:Uncharacterized protein n=1 Tax=Plenodomus tracheiphilus IPT5 TaxID=1408161 RepID=A0A6A7AP59_9PLEO|nr:hypothetical protein T440DRAFT_522972 [Plenodomus tracheiphilus IPT5]
MTNLNSRVKTNSIGILNLDGTTTIQTKDQLTSVLSGINPPHSPIAHFKLRQLYEYRLNHWVIANAAAFPELVSMSTMFTSILSCNTVVLDTLIGSRKLLPENRAQCKQKVEMILGKLRRRIDFQQTGRQFSIEVLRTELLSIITAARYNELAKRNLLEKVLRRIVFCNRAKFPELKFSPVVKAWEGMTGQKW